MNNASPLLDVCGLSLRLGDRPRLSDVDLRLSPGEIHALIGSNGAGKSTLAYTLMGSEGYRPQSGEIRFRGKSVLDLAMHERARLGITLAWQEPTRIEGLSIPVMISIPVSASFTSFNRLSVSSSTCDLSTWYPSVWILMAVQLSL